MTGFNHFTILGIAGEAEERMTKGGKPWLILPVDVESYRRTTDNAPAQKECTTVPISLFSKVAETAKQYVRPGDAVAIQCRVQGGEYTDKNGVLRRSVTVTADQLHLIPNGRKQGGGYERNQP
jgi:single-stranded DNA-binding protein